MASDDQPTENGKPAFRTLKVPGRKLGLPPPARAVPDAFADLVRARVREEVRIDGPGRSAEGEVTIEGVSPDTLVELDLGEGVRWWMRVDELADWAVPEESARGAGGDGAHDLDVLRLPPTLTIGGRQRGAGGLALAGLRILDLDLAEMGALELAAGLENRLRPGPGLYVCSGKDFESLGQRIEAPDDLPAGDGPFLIFLHGTASSTLGSFGDLGSELPRLHRRYGERRVLAFEHRSLTHSPGDNARDLLKLLPTGAELHMVSHSRGGLVGELLCRGSYSNADRKPIRNFELDFFRHHERRDAEVAAREVATLEELGRLLEEKRPRVRRFVRVACPARGTNLASGRLDRALALLLNALKLGVPILAGSQIYDFLQALVRATARQRTRPDVLPGIEAMMPTSPWIRLLNHDPSTLQSDLSVVAGDVEGAGVLGRLAVFALDTLLFREDHDLVVHTRAMFGGGARARGLARKTFERGPETTHFTYFRRRRESILSALERDDPEGFQPFEAAAPERSAGRAVRRVPLEPLADRPVAVLLPGIMGSHLSVDGNRIWLDVDDLAFGGLGRLRAGADVVPDGVIDRYYGALADFLAESHQVVPFDYDWRLSIVREGERLRHRLTELLGATDQPIRLIAHSMGGLVAMASALGSAGDAAWRDLRKRRGFRFVMLGTPSRGSHVISQIVFGRERIVRRLALLDLKHSKRQLLEITGRFQGLYDLLPATVDDDPIFDLQTWKRWNQAEGEDWPTPLAEHLNAARSLRKELDALDLGLAPDQWAYVAGQAPATPVAVEIDEGSGRARLAVMMIDRGDGRVPWETGPPAGVRVWWTDAVHGSLPCHEAAFDAYLELLETGQTSRLPSTAPATRGITVRLPRPADGPELFPSAEDLLEAAIGDEPQPVRDLGLAPLEVGITHGDLRFARHPVLVGHYEDDFLYSAEATIDRQLHGRLERVHSLGLYPGPVGTAEVFLDPTNSGRGAVIIGLGRVGKLAVGDLVRAIKHGALRYALALEAAASGDDTNAGGSREVALSSLLIGSGDGTGITIPDSLRVIIEGVSAANQILAESGSSRLRFTHLEVVELVEGRSLSALHALEKLAAEPSLSQGRVIAQPGLRRVDGGIRRLRANESEDWWQRLEIRVAERPEKVAPVDRPLVFTSLSDRARAEQQLVATQRRLVERFVEDAIGDTRWDAATATTLFELLLPNELKDQAPRRQDLVLVVDEHSGAYPWELLHDGLTGQGRPLAVQAGIVRQLVSREYRRPVDHPADDAALVIGDPPSGWPALPGAQQEAERVAAMLDAEGWQVTALIRPSGRQVLTALFGRGYRVVHVAAHGIFDPADVDGGGIVIGPQMFLRPGDIDQMRQVPELVFVNCCHLGRLAQLDPRLQRRRNDLAANVGIQLIRMGVRAVVAAGWVVDDAAAATFADEIYRLMLGGEPFGKAVELARRRTYDEHRAVNTWGAYQCYGDPWFRLREPRGRQTAVTLDAVDPMEAELRLENLTSQSRVGTDPQRLRGELAELLKILERQHPEWLGHAGVRSRLGEAFSELADLEALGVVAGVDAGATESAHHAYAAAIGHLRAALGCDRGSTSMDLARRWVQLESRVAVFRFKYPAADDAGSAAARRQTLRKSLKRALDNAERLLGVSETVWRWTLIGSIRCHLALAQNGVKPQNGVKHLREAAEAFRRAHERALASTGHAETYPALSWCLVEAVHGLLAEPTDRTGGAVSPGIDAVLGPVLRAGLDAAASDHSFWRRAALGDAELIQMIAAGVGPDDPGAKRLDEVLSTRSRAAVEHYAGALHRGGSPRQHCMLIESLDWVLDLLTGADERRARVRAAVADVRRAFVETVAGRLSGS